MSDVFEDAALFVHRRPNPRAHHPLLVWHLGIWNPISPMDVGLEQADEQVAKAMLEREARTSRYTCALLDRIKAGLSDVPDPETGLASFQCSQGTDGPWTLSPATPLSCAFSLGALRAQIRLDLQPEYLTITTLFDLAPAIGEYHWHNCPEPVRDLIVELDSFHGKIEKALKTGLDRLSREDLTALADACFEDIWQHFGTQILQIGSVEFAGLGRRFADFRGFYLGDEIQKPEIPMNAQPRPVRFQRPFWHATESNRRDHRGKLLGVDEWRERFHLLWPLMTAPVKNRDIVDHEFTATIFEGSALHLTGMGARPTTGSSPSQTPLYYGVFTSGMGGWAIGRLVNQLSELGTLRLSATQEFDKLEAASQPLREAEIAVQEAFDRDLSTGPDVIADGDSTIPLQTALKWIHERKQRADAEVPGGIAYRAAQSASYIRRFREVLRGLKVEAYDDFQAYNKYVNAHHGAAFSYIESLGSRHVRLMHDMRSLYQRMVAEEGRNRYLEIVSIQRLAEFLSIAILAPYYLGIVLSHSIWGSSETMPRIVWVTLVAACVSAAILMRWYKPETSKRNRRANKLLLFAVFVGVAALGLAVYHWAPKTVASAQGTDVEPSANAN